MTYDELKKLRQQLSAEPVTVDEFSGVTRPPGP